jgi:transposase-like protein
MAEDRMAVLEMLRKLGADGDVDFLREGVRVLAAALMEAEVTELTGVPKGERAPERRLTNRNGYRERRWVLTHPAMQVFSGRSHLDRTRGARAVAIQRVAP